MIGGNPTAPPGYKGRLDLNYDSYIDISLEQAVYGQRC